MSPRRGPRPAIDWAEARRRLAAAGEAIEAGGRETSPARAREILEERARLIARRPAAAEAPGRRLDVVTFSLGRERWAIEARLVREVVRLESLTPVPGAPPVVLGVTNLRGEVLPVFDLRRVFGIEAPGLTDLARVIVLGAERADLGVVADTADEVARMGADELRDPPASLAADRRALVRGVAGGGIVVLDGERLLEDPRLFAGARASGDEQGNEKGEER